MPRGRLMKPLKVLATPGMFLFDKYSQYKRQQEERDKRKVTEKELQHLNQKIDKLLLRLEESDGQQAHTDMADEECVICLQAKATMETQPCGHCVVCRRCFVKTIQAAIAQRCLPLRCVVCRSRILKLKPVSTIKTSASSSFIQAFSPRQTSKVHPSK